MNELVHAVSIALVHFLWQGAAIAALLALALRSIRGANATLRYAIAVGAMGLMLALPLATAAANLVRGQHDPQPPLAHSTIPASTPTTPLPASDVVVPALDGGAIGRGAALGTFRRGMVLLWFTGVLAFSLMNAGGWLQIQRLRRSGVRIDGAAWARRIERLRERLGIGRRIDVLESVRVDVPTVIGWLRPVILVPPAALIGISPQALEALLLHELAHVRRHDYLVNLLQATVEALLFYHPAVWWVSRQVRAEREHCCDDLAVASCGSRRTYLHALAEMERLRHATPRLAVAADGGSLVNRIRRLTDSKYVLNGNPARWSMALATLTIAVVAGLVQFAWAVPANARPGDPGSPASDMIDGTWQAKIGRGEVWLQLHRTGPAEHRMSFTLPASDFTGTGEDGIPGFMLRRDAGTFYFEGALDGSERDRRFEFRADPEYAIRMRAIGFEPADSARKHYEYAALKVTTAFAEGIRDAGYGDIGMKRLVEFRIHGVTPEFVRGMAESGFDDLPAKRLVEFRIHGVTPGFVRGMAESGFDDLPAKRLVEFRIHGVTPGFVRGMADSGFPGLTAQRLVEFRIHGVTPEFVRGMASSGFPDLTAQRLVEFRIHGVTPEFVQAMADSGFRDLTAERLVEFRIHGISPEFVRGMAAAGYEELAAQRLVEFRIHGVSPEFVREMAGLGLDGIPARKLVEMRIHGVSASFVQSARERYGDDLSVDELIELRIHGGAWKGERGS